MKWFAVLAMACVEDGTRRKGEDCFEDFDCVRDLVCGACLDCVAPDDPSADLQGDAAAAACDAVDDGYITCNDGTVSPSCTTCEAGCCSSHGGCE